MRRFAPRWPTTLAALTFVTLTLALGQWQTRRAETKMALQEAVERGLSAPPLAIGTALVAADAARGRRVVARGEYDGSRTVLLDNRVQRGRPGYEVVTPLRVEGGDRLLLVNRGWTPAGRTREELPSVSTPGGVVRVEGVAVVPPEKFFELGPEAPGRRWQHLRLDRYAAWAGSPVQPFIVQQTSDAADGLVRDWPRPDLGVDKHKAYALQWYAFAVLTVILYVVLNFERESPRGR
jgi:surfeit locus 1 family protein